MIYYPNIPMACGLCFRTTCQWLLLQSLCSTIYESYAVSAGN